MAYDTYRQMLIDKRDEVVTSLVGARFDSVAKADRMAEEDQAQATHDEFVSLRLNRLDYGQLRQIEAALDRISAGDYGICQGCEEPIPAKRLRALPWARFCVACQERMADGDATEEGRIFHPALVGR